MRPVRIAPIVCLALLMCACNRGRGSSGELRDQAADANTFADADAVDGAGGDVGADVPDLPDTEPEAGPDAAPDTAPDVVADTRPDIDPEDAAVDATPDVIVDRALAQISLAAGGDFTCVLDELRRPTCFGDASFGAAGSDIFDGAALGTIDAQFNTFCGILDDGGVRCVGGSPVASATPSESREGGFVDLAVSTSVACALEPSGAVQCWSARGEIEAPASTEGGFTTIHAGAGFQCGHEPSGLVVCTGNPPRSREDEPDFYSERFTLIGSDYGSICGSRADGSVRCAADAAVPVPAPSSLEGGFVEIDSGWSDVCGLEPSGVVQCWGGAGRESISDNIVQSVEGGYVDIAVGSWHACGLEPSGDVRCWGTPLSSHGPLLHPAERRYRAVDARFDATCALDDEGEAECWGQYVNTNGPPSSTEGGFDELALGLLDFCAREPSGEVVCWGPEPTTPLESLEGGFASLHAARRAFCGVEPSGAIRCWGEESRLLDPPEVRGQHARVSVGDQHACVLNEAFELSCWGDDTFGQLSGAPDSARDVAAGSQHTCALDEAGAVSCWGDDNFDLLDPPVSAEGGFTALLSGGVTSCASEPSGALQCWGRLAEELSSLTDGTPYDAASMGNRHLCVIDESEALRCDGPVIARPLLAPVWVPERGD